MTTTRPCRRNLCDHALMNAECAYCGLTELDVGDMDMSEEKYCSRCDRRTKWEQKPE